MKSNNQLMKKGIKSIPRFKYHILALAIGFFQYYALKDFYVTEAFISDLITIMSIWFGFNVTSLAIFSTSKFVPSLFKIEDENDRSKTLLHTLFHEYRDNLKMTMCFTMYLVFIQFIIQQTALEEISACDLRAILLLPILGIIFLKSYILIRNLINAIIKDMIKQLS